MRAIRDAGGEVAVRLRRSRVTVQGSMQGSMRAVLALATAALVALTAARASAVAPRTGGAPPVLRPTGVMPPPVRDAVRFGERVAASGELLAVSAPTSGDDGNLPGRVDVFALAASARGATSTKLLATLARGAGGDHFGSSLAIQTTADLRRTTLVVGADATTIDVDRGDRVGGFEGAVHVYESTGPDAGFSHAAELYSASAESGAEFGCAVAVTVEQDTIAAGARRHDDNTVFDAGSVEIFVRSPAVGAPWRSSQILRSSEPQMSAWFGASVALGESADGAWLAVGAPGHDLSPSLQDAGVVHLYRRARDGSYRAALVLAPPTPRRAAWFGAVLAIHEGRLLVGEPRGQASVDRGDACTGIVWSYALDAIESMPIALEPQVSQSGAGFGQSIGCGDGVVAVGAPGFDALVPGNGAAAPRARLEDVGAAYAFTPDGVLLHALEGDSRHASALFGASAAVVAIPTRANDADHATARTPCVAVGHLFVEEESPSPSAGVALFVLPQTAVPAVTPGIDEPIPITAAGRTTSRASAASRPPSRSR